ncbi:hypothetical protein, partial [Roseateles sp. P5_E11]
MTYRLAAPFLSAALLSACSTYSIEPGADVARVRLVTYTNDKTQFSVHDLDACPVRKQVMRKVISGEKIRRSVTLGMKGRADPYANDVAEFMLPAGHKLAVLVGSSKDVGPTLFSNGYYCSVGILLAPKPGSDYEVQLESSSFRCRARVFKLV